MNVSNSIFMRGVDSRQVSPHMIRGAEIPCRPAVKQATPDDVDVELAADVGEDVVGCDCWWGSDGVFFVDVFL